MHNCYKVLQKSTMYSGYKWTLYPLKLIFSLMKIEIFSIKAYCLLVFLASYSILSAEEQVFSLSEALLKAQTVSSDEMQIIESRLEAKQQEVRSVKSAVYPVVRFNTDLVYQDLASKSILPPGISIDQSRFQGADYSWSLSFEQPLITFGRLGVLTKIVRKTLQSLELQYDLEKERYYYDVIRSYVAVVLAEEQYKASLRRYQYLSELKKQIEKEYQGGLRSKMDILEATSHYKLAKADSARYKLEAKSQKSRFKSLLNYPEEKLLMCEFNNTDSLIFEGKRRQEAVQRKDLELSKIFEENASYWARYERANLLPAISLTGSLFDKVQDFDGAFDSDMKGLVDPDFMSYTVGLKLKWTLFDGFKTSSRVKQKIAEAKIAQRQWSKLKREIETSQKESKDLLEVSGIIYEATASAENAARLLFEQAQREYQQGALNMDRMLKLESNYREIQTRFYESFYKKVLAQANYYVSQGWSLQEESP